MLIRKRRPEVSLEQKSTQGETETIEDVKPNIFVDWSNLPERELLTSEGTELLNTAIQSMPEILRIVFVLRDMEGLSIKETADTLSLTETNVKTRLARARMYLRERLSKYYSELLREDER